MFDEGAIFVIGCLLVGALLCIICLPFVLWRDKVDTEKKARYWREKWHYDFSGKNETLLRPASDPAKPVETLLRASGTSTQDRPENLLRATNGEKRNGA